MVVVTNKDPHNLRFIERVRGLAAQAGVPEALHIDQHEDLHAKGLLGDDYHLHGSMNFTHNGIRVLAEEIVLDLDADHVQRTRLDYLERVGRVERP